jgi:hypothetical protein
VSQLLEALDREIEFFEDVMVNAKAYSESYNADACALVYLSVKDTVQEYTNDIERINAIANLASTLALGSLCCALLNDFLAVNEAHYVLNYPQTVQVVKTLKGLSYDELADKLFEMSMTCDPEYLKEILAKQA